MFPEPLPRSHRSTKLTASSTALPINYTPPLCEESSGLDGCAQSVSAAGKPFG